MDNNTSRPSKRIRLSNNEVDGILNEPPDQLNDGTSQSNHVQSDQSICYISTLSPDTFTHLCSYLALSTKLTRFRVLNKHFFWRLDPLKHCKNDILVINQSACEALDDVGVASICSMIALVPVIHVDFDLPYDHKPISGMSATNCSSHQDDDTKNVDEEDLPITSVLSALARALSGSKLQTLNFAESSKFSSGSGDLEVISELIEEVDAIKQPITLGELMIELKGERLRSSTADYQFIPWIDMSSLLRSETLHTIRLVLYGASSMIYQNKFKLLVCCRLP